MPHTCSVCNGVSDGFHFGVEACRACSSFFRRTLAENKARTYHCHKNGNCNISQNFRNICRACRLQKCLQMGMKRSDTKTDSDTDLNSPLSSDNVLTTSSSPRMIQFDSDYLKNFENIWKSFVSSLKSLYIVQNPTSIFNEIQASEYKLITKSEYDKLEKASISIIFSLFLENIPPFKRLEQNDRIKTLRIVTRGISMLFKAVMTSIVFPNEENKVVMAGGYYSDLKRLDYFFEQSEGYEEASKMIIPVMNSIRKLGKEVKNYRDVDLGITIVFLLAEKMKQMEIATEADEVYWKSALSDVHTEHIKTFGMKEGGLRFANILLNLLSLTNMINLMNESIIMARIFCPESLMDVWSTVYLTSST